MESGIEHSINHRIFLSNENSVKTELQNGISEEDRNGIANGKKMIEKQLKTPSFSVKKPLLLTRNEVPCHLQFNPYIYTGYRPLLSLWESILSLCYFHNESINVITHGIPMLYILIWWRNMIPWSDVSVPFLPWIHIVSSVSPWVGSTIYHLFMNHRSGARCYKVLLHLDMFGIWITQSFGALTTVYASIFCLGSAWIWKILTVYCIVSLWCLYKVFRARNPWERRFCYTFPILMRAAAVSVRGSSVGGGHPDALVHVFLQDFLAIIGGFVGAMRIPEKWMPGKMDLIANSHHIMHVIVVYAVYHLHQGAVLDLQWLSQNDICLTKS